MTDDGSPPLSDAKTFSISVAAPPVLQGLELGETEVTLSWSAIPGAAYRVQFTTDLGDPEWQHLAPDVVATGASAEFMDSRSETQKFHRIVVLE